MESRKNFGFLWTQPLRPQLFTLGAFPIFNMQAPKGHYHGFPEYGFPGFKIGKYHHHNEHVDPDHMDRDCHPEDEAVLREAIHNYFPDADGPALAMKTCLFTNSPDEHLSSTITRNTAKWPSPPASPATASNSAASSERSWRSLR